MPTQISRTITRQGPYDRAYNFYAKRGAVPLEPGDGIYVTTQDIQPWESYIIFTWTPPDDGTWNVIAEPLYQDMNGPSARITT